jgi:hypothetical protein
MEAIFFAVLSFATLRTVMPSSSEPVLLPKPIPTASVKAPHASSSHVSTTSGDGNNVYNVSFVNNNGNQPPAPQPTTYESAQQYFKKTINGINLSDIGSNISQYCSENKYYIGASLILGGYLYMFYRLRVIQSYVDNKPSWGAWKKDVPMEKLLAIPQDKLTHDLMMTIQERYISIENPTDSLTPLMNFSKEIADEKELVNTYHTYVSWCSQCSLNTIMPFSQTLLAQLAERKQRVTYVSTLFQSWLANYKLEQIKHSRTVLDIPMKEYRVEPKG